MTTDGDSGGLEQVWVLHTRPYRNTSLILELFGERRGRIGAVARSGRKNHLLQAFRPLRADFHGRGELLTLGHCEAEGPALPLTGRGLFCGLYLNELLTRLLHRFDPHPELLSPYVVTLSALAQDGVPQDVLLRRFELTLLDVLGYGLALEQDANGAPVRADGTYQLDPHQGLLPAREGWPGNDLLAIAADAWHDSARRTARQLLRAALAPHLGSKPLMSRELFR
ncbi:DNA repair protein RecO [Alcanivorax sp. JB21]|uniref:DNA repair protein RecO n=1 Tax=Alcanivorax limicola TaxID=2874102 RepID=UPI001CBB7A1D|nr:DNA repair protein RecO [Alcanivorax limicola]MBZ2189839.1 DNA repair protein RecO [Alcanivorax limicola]